MQYYSYTADTKEFIGQGTAQLDPLESKKQGKEVFLLPAKMPHLQPPLRRKTALRVSGTVRRGNTLRTSAARNIGFPAIRGKRLPVK